KIALQGNNFNRAIGRIAGKGGSTIYTIENATKTRIVVNGRKVHFLGSEENVKLAKIAVHKLIVGAPANKVYGTLRTIVSKTSSYL
ncbi:MAG: pre-rRNA-processing protein pno1, partial [Paramarteilia canceri]